MSSDGNKSKYFTLFTKKTIKKRIRFENTPRHIPTIRISELLLRQPHNGTAQSKEYPNEPVVTS